MVLYLLLCGFISLQPAGDSVKFPASNYLRRGGYVFVRVCLFVSRITQKLLDRFSQNSVGKTAHGPRKKDYTLVVIRISLR